MVKVQEHIEKMNEIKQYIKNSKGIQRKQYIKCLHRLQKQLSECYMYQMDKYVPKNKRK